MPDGKSSGAGTLSRGHDDRATFGKIRPAVVGQDFQKKMFDGNRRGRSRVCRRVCSERRGALGRARARARARCKFPSGYVLHRVKGNKFVRGLRLPQVSCSGEPGSEVEKSIFSPALRVPDALSF